MAKRKAQKRSEPATAPSLRVRVAEKQSETVVQFLSMDLDASATAGGLVAAVPLLTRAGQGQDCPSAGGAQAGSYVACGAQAQRLPALCANGLQYLLFLFPQAVLHAVALESGYDFLGAQAEMSPIRIVDETLCRLAATLEAALEPRQETPRLFVYSVTRATAAHLVACFGRKRDEQTAKRGGLAPWQEKRALEMLEANLYGEIPLGEIAEQCRLSERHFSRAFTQSTGMPPQRWLMKRRVETAKELLLSTDLSLATIAKQSGFADQSYLTRVFSDWVGKSPGAWRRSNRLAPPLGNDVE